MAAARPDGRWRSPSMRAQGRAQVLQAVLAALLGRWPRALASAATFASAPRAAPRAADGHGSEPLLAAGGERQQPWLTRWSRVARESTVRLVSRSRVPQAHWLGGPATLVGRRGPPWPARVARPGQYAWGRRASLVRATQPPWLGHTSRTGASARARLGGGHPGWLATYGRWPYTYTLFLNRTRRETIASGSDLREPPPPPRSLSDADDLPGAHDAIEHERQVDNFHHDEADAQRAGRAGA